RVPGHADLDAVDGAADRSHQAPAPDVANRVEAIGSNGQPCCSQWAMYSSLKYCTEDVIGLVAPSPRAQNDRPRMLSHASSSVSRCSAVRMGVDEPPGVQNFSWCPARTPPAASSSSRSVTPSGASYWPGRVTCPDSE